MVRKPPDFSRRCSEACEGKVDCRDREREGRYGRRSAITARCGSKDSSRLLPAG